MKNTKFLGDFYSVTDDMEEEDITELMLMHYELYKQFKKENKYVKSGSILWCNAGSKLTRFDILKDHAVEADGAPVGICTDCKENENIFSFGGCNKPTPDGYPKRKEIVIDATSSRIYEREKCIPILLDTWKSTDINTLKIYDYSEKKYYDALTTGDYLTCFYGGLIRVVEVPAKTNPNIKLITLTQMNQVVGADDQGNKMTWTSNTIRDVITWNLSTYIPTYAQSRPINQSDINAINKCIIDYDITIEQLPHFIAQVSHECACGNAGVEKFSTDPKVDFQDRDTWRENFDDVDLKATEAFYADKNKIKQYATNNNLGAKYKNYGAKYRGAGALQLTHYCEYKGFSDFINDPKIVSEGAGYVAKNYFWDSAGWLWKYYYKMEENYFSNGSQPTVEQITKKINGGTNGLNERTVFYQSCINIFK